MKFLQTTKSKLIFCYFFLFNALLAFAANPLSDFKSKADKEFNETMKTILGLVNTISMTVGIAWIIACILMYIGAPERFKDNLKQLIIITVIIGLVYGLSSAYS